MHGGVPSKGEEDSRDGGLTPCLYPLASRSPGRLLVVAHRPLRRLSLSPASSFISVGKTLSCVPHQVDTGCPSLLSASSNGKIDRSEGHDRPSIGQR